jgi:transposase-like protein
MKARSRHSPILTGDLVCHLFGVTPQTVTKWRAALEVSHATPETSERKAAPKRGVARPPHIVAILRRTGRTVTAAHRAKIRATNLRNGTRPPKAGRPWTPQEDALLVKLRPPAVAKRTGRTLSAVYTRRALLGVPDGRPGRVIDVAVSRRGD